MKFKNHKDNLFTSTRLKLDLIASVFVFFVLSSFSYVVYKLLTLDIIYQISPIFKNTDIAGYINSDKLFSDFRDQTVFLLIASDIIIFILSIIFFDRFVKKMLTPIEYLSSVQKKFAENVSHELRTPLSIMNMHGEILMEKIDKEEKNNQDNNIENREKFLINFKKGTETILSEIKTITSLIDDLLFEARIKYTEVEADEVEIQKAKEILEKVVENLSVSKSPNVEVFLNIKIKSSYRSKIKINPLHLERIFNNLISNGLKFTNVGKVEISIEEYKRKFKKNLRFVISDTGIGIKEKDLKKVSERFFRGENAEKETSGTGLGLAIIKDLVKDYGLDMKIESKEGIGTKVIIQNILIY
ncbi:MAG: Sensor histidine kinase RcsC [Patescibacteria group bacterium]|nr:Sensor histidine kinase RcsC [Patescibacteria group bacterium]